MQSMGQTVAGTNGSWEKSPTPLQSNLEVALLLSGTRQNGFLALPLRLIESDFLRNVLRSIRVIFEAWLLFLTLY